MKIGQLSFILKMETKRKAENMKKILIIMALAAFTAPAFAACSITGGACTASVLDKETLQEKYIPDNLKEIQKTDAFNPRYVTPYYDMLLNTEESTAQTTESPNYNSNCQFGVCLPGVEPDSGTIFD